jgi:hypothetical protein
MTDLRRDAAPRHGNRVPLTLPVDGPVLLALSPALPKPPTITGPSDVVAGSLVPFRLAPGDTSDGATHVLHIDVIDPTGQIRAPLSENILMRAGESPWLLRLAADDPPGIWRVRVSDRLGGGTTEMVLRVESAL